ncbi:MAG: rane fusion protein multidrug efflux system [Alphaproteobacteria bacterium]|jgi:RND family efflux transporter MFP subunit|nr:rane fusion protein multidrug efflux system [Alphaproteobacteria bacterium]
MISFKSSRFIASWLVLAPLLTACGENQQQAAPPPPAVTVAKPVKQMVTDQDEYVGRFVAVDAVEVRTRVAGTLDAVHFKDGQIVAKGDLLFSIDHRPFENTLAQARANLLLARSNLTFAESDLTRGQQLVKERTISEQVYDQRAQTKRNAEASVAANQAAVSQAELDLEFTEIQAPISGRIGDRRVSPGNLVAAGAGATVLATIVSTDPIRFEFTFDEASLLRYDRLAKQTADPTTRGLSLPLKLKLIDEQDFLHEGKMDFVDNVIDSTSGTIRGRAVFANKDEKFVPGMFGRVQIPAGPPAEALLVPDSAIGTDQTRKFVYVVEADNSAKQVYVTLGSVFDGRRVVKDGLTPESRVVVNGLMRVRPGIKVTPQEEGAAPPAPGTPTAAK